LGTRSTTSYSTLSEARELAARHSLYIVLKGRYTAICTPGGKTFFNPTGNSGMATAGSGDVLTGIITSLLAQHYTPQDASIIGTFLHGLAGDIAAERWGEESLIASDITDALPDAFRRLRQLIKKP
ncbi:MAG: NAD(P)H-hydrate dehydratase, partial [Alloprevotella sp.]|nr:NAD(P)H-hydrate dehydratase [Alloprevotella sp.]